MFVMKEAEDRTIPEDFPVSAKVAEVGSKTYNKRDGSGTFEKAEFWFEITAPEEFAGRKVRGSTWPDLNNRPDCQLRIWVETLIGRDLTMGEAFDEQQLVGLPCDLTVTHRPGSDGKIYEDVERLLPPAGGIAGSAAVNRDDLPF